MRILLAHNRYQGRGGEDVVFEAEAKLLRQAGHAVETLEVSNAGINSVLARIKTTLQIADNAEGRNTLAAAIDQFTPDIVHVHNFFPLLSPAIFDMCRDKRVPAVVTLHNYRIICTGGMLLRDGLTCHKCLEHGHIWGVVHRCYRGSLPGSAASAYMIAHHQSRGTWTRPGIRLIALTRFAREVFAGAGLVRDMIDVKPNFMNDPGEPDDTVPRDGLLYAGRLSPEKGLDVLMQAMVGTTTRLRVAGEGPELARLKARAPANVTFLGAQSHAQIFSEMSRAQALVVPSLWYEGFPMVVVEAFAHGTPVIASRIGALAEIVEDGVSGRLAPAGDAEMFRQIIVEVLADRAFLFRAGQAAREAYRQLYTPSQNLKQLEAVYQQTILESGLVGRPEP